MPRKKQEPRKIISLNIYPLDNVTPENILQAEPVVEFMIDQTIAGIKDALRTRKNTATLFQINNQDAYLEIEKPDWKSALSNCIKYYSEKEKYEICSEIQTLIKKLNSQKKELV